MNTKDKFTQKVMETIEKYHMISAGEQVIAGVSGGADSVCLLAVLKIYREQCPFQLTVVHVEHGLRGRESLEDAAFVERLCKQWELPCEICHVDVKSQACQTGQTMEEAARELRYGVFKQYCKKIQAEKIVVAHNQNDQAETVLLNLTRGSGLRGLGGILPVRRMEDTEMEYQIVRPLLFVSRKEIENWLESQELTYRTDRTNLETEYTRNKLRIEILPKLEQEINREAVKHMADAAAHLQKAEAYLQRIAEEKFSRCVDLSEKEAVIKLPLFLKEDSLMQEYMLRLSIEKVLRGRGLRDYSGFHIEEMRRLARMDCGKRMDFPGGLQGMRRKDELWLYLRQAGSGGKIENFSREAGKNEALEEALGEEKRYILDAGTYHFAGCRFQVEYLELEGNMQTFPEKKYTKWLAYDTIKHDVCLRTRKTGDYLIVNQAGGRKKLKDYMIDQKIPREERDRILLVADGSHVLWVVGWRISEAAKVTAQSKKIMKIQMMEEEV